MSGKRYRDQGSDYHCAVKYSKHQSTSKKGNHHSSTDQRSDDPVEEFYVALVACRKSIANLDLKSNLPMIFNHLQSLVSCGLGLTRLPVDLAQFLDAFRKLQQFSAREKPSSNNILRLVMLLDDVYYTLYYCLDVHNRSQTAGGRRFSIASPHVYFTSAIYSVDSTVELNAILKAYLTANMSARAMDKFKLVWGPLLQSANNGDNDNKKKNSSNSSNNGGGTTQLEKRNPLLQVHFSRWRESVCLLNELGLIPTVHQLESMLKTLRPQVLDSPNSATMKGTDPLLPSVLRQYADSCRVWPCHVYAFATPTAAALERIASCAPVLEIGAGTGYWSHMLRTYHPSIKVIAYDKDPPTTQGKMIKPNDYHGKSRAWTQVLKGGPEVAAQYSNYALFLCYPPPDNAMALQALRTYTGSTVCYVGELQGDTGTKAFEKLLHTEFTCEDLLDLPNWSDTCYTLTVWKRRVAASTSADNTKNPKNLVSDKNGNPPQNSAQGDLFLPHRVHPFLCSQCGTGRKDRSDISQPSDNSSHTTNSSSGSSSGGEVRQLHRCRMCYHTYFCSSQCAKKGRDLHLAELAVRCLLQDDRSRDSRSNRSSSDCGGIEDGDDGGCNTTREIIADHHEPLVDLSPNYFVKVHAPVIAST